MTRPPVAVLVGAAALVVAVVLPYQLSRAAVAVYILIGLSAIVAVGVSMLMGYAGQVSIGQAAFYAVGAYTAGYLTTSGYPPLLGLLLAPVIAFALGLLIGWPLLRLRGHFLAFGTLALLLVVTTVISQVDELGGATGIQAIPFLGVGSLELRRPADLAVVVLAALVVVMVVARNIVSSRTGRALRALATSEVAAASAGVDVARAKRTVFAVSAAFAGLAGALYAFFIGSISPASFTVAMSIQFLVFAVVGGLQTVVGPVVGTVAVTLLLQLLNTVGTQPGLPAEAPALLNYAAYAVLLVATVLLLPGGVYGAITSALARRGAPPGPAPGPFDAAASRSLPDHPRIADHSEEPA